MKNNHGGKRVRSGRKKVTDPAIQLSIYPKESLIKNVGGRERAKVVCLAALISEAAKFGLSHQAKLDKALKKHLVK